MKHTTSAPGKAAISTIGSVSPSIALAAEKERTDADIGTEKAANEQRGEYGCALKEQLRVRHEIKRAARAVRALRYVECASADRNGIAVVYRVVGST